MRQHPLQRPCPHHRRGAAETDAIAETNPDRIAVNGDFIARMDLDVTVEADMGMQAFAGLLDFDRAADIEPPGIDPFE